jgi:hypothetical protein
MDCSFSSIGVTATEYSRGSELHRMITECKQWEKGEGEVREHADRGDGNLTCDKGGSEDVK